MEEPHVAGGAEVIRVLQPDEDPHLAGALHGVEIGGRVDPHEDVRPVGNQGVVGRDVVEDVDVPLGVAAPSYPDRNRKDVDLRVAEFPKIGVRESIE